MADLLNGATDDWYQIGNEKFYQKIRKYPFNWSHNVPFTQNTVIPSPHGGPIAIAIPHKGSEGSFNVYFVNNAGISYRVKKKIDLTKNIKMSWTAFYEFISVSADGEVKIYNIINGKCTNNSCLSTVIDRKREKIVDVLVFKRQNKQSGIVFLSNLSNLYLLHNVRSNRLDKLPKIPDLKVPVCWTVGEERDLNVLIGTNAALYSPYPLGEKISIGDDSCMTRNLLLCASSFTGARIALYNSDGILWMGTANMKKTILQILTSMPNQPTQMAWCGQHVVALHCGSVLYLYADDGELAQFFVDPKTILVAEIDSLRLLMPNRQEIIVELDEQVVDTLRIGSTAPSIYLLRSKLSSDEQESVANMLMIRDQLSAAARECYKASLHIPNPQLQRWLLLAATFGKSSCSENTDPDAIKRCVCNIRLINTVNQDYIGIPITYKQLEDISLDVFLTMLTNLHLFQLGVEISRFFKLPFERCELNILMLWANEKTTEANPDNIISAAIRNRFLNIPNIPYAEIAAKALKCGRTNLALDLVSYDKSPSRQALLLLKMGRHVDALKKINDFYDPDLMHRIIISHMKPKLTKEIFYRDLCPFPSALNYYLQYCHDFKDFGDILYFYEIQDNHSEIAYWKIRLCNQRKESSDKLLEEAGESFGRHGKDFEKNEVKLQQIFLKRYRQFGKPESVRSLLTCLFGTNALQTAEEVRNTFKLSNKRWYIYMVDHLSKMRKWTEMTSLLKSKKSPPCGFLPFAKAFMHGGQNVTAMQLIEKGTAEEKVKFYLEFGMYEMAGECAFKDGDDKSIGLVFDRCKRDNMMRVFDECNAKFGSQG